ncbi:MAG: (Na+)-NQR maturation NqrM [Pseudomonadales bacterium]
MSTAILAFIIMLAIVAAMAIGVIFGRKPISGSCGGIGQFGISAECDICGGNPQRCEENRAG